MKAYKIELLMLNFEGYDAEQVRVIAENARGLESSVMAIEEREIGEWSDDHPLNHRGTAAAEYARLFGAASPVQGAASAISRSTAAEGQWMGDTAASATDQGAAVKPWGDRISRATTPSEAMLAEIADLRAALAERAQAAQPTGAKVVATVIKTGAYRQWMSEALGSLPDGAYELCLATPAPEQEAAPLDRKPTLIQACEEGNDRESPSWFEIHANSVRTYREEGYRVRWLYEDAAPVEQEAAQVVSKADDQSHVMPRFAAPAGQHWINPEAERGLADPLYSKAVMIVRGTNHGSLSLLQRHFLIGYNRAARLLEAMEAAGVVSKIGPNGARTVLAAAPEQSAASGSREGRDALNESSGKGCATATNTNQPEGEKGGAA